MRNSMINFIQIRRTRQIIRYRAAATLTIHCNTLPQMRGCLQNQREYHIILTKYKAVHQAVVLGNYSSIVMLTFFFLLNSKQFKKHFLLTNSILSNVLLTNPHKLYLKGPNNGYKSLYVIGFKTLRMKTTSFLFPV